MKHYNTDKISDEAILDGVNHDTIDEPCFVGQGWSNRVGSDCYGGYVVCKKEIRKKIVWGLVSARTTFGPNGWTSGSQICTLPDGKTRPEDCKPTKWITQSGWWKKSDRPKFYFCTPDGKKMNGKKCTYCWNGAHAYQDPSF